MADVSPAQERYIWRRLAAAILDLLIIGVVIDLGLAVFTQATGTFVAPIVHMPVWSVCAPGQPKLGPDSPPVDISAWQNISVCEVSVLLHGSARFAHFSNVKVNGNTRKTEFLTLPLSADGTLREPQYAASLLPLLLYPPLIVLEALFGAGPGKRLLGLRVEGIGRRRVGFRRSLIRNIVRLLPLLTRDALNVLGIAILAASPESDIFAPGRQISVWVWILAIVLPLAAAAAVWIVPLIRTRAGGRLMPHNRAARTQVLRAGMAETA